MEHTNLCALYASCQNEMFYLLHFLALHNKVTTAPNLKVNLLVAPIFASVLSELSWEILNLQ
jgi:hypothetical protein